MEITNFIEASCETIPVKFIWFDFGLQGMGLWKYKMSTTVSHEHQLQKQNNHCFK